eukprot:3371885-Amphidinium_carterae.1
MGCVRAAVVGHGAAAVLRIVDLVMALRCVLLLIYLGNLFFTMCLTVPVIITYGVLLGGYPLAVARRFADVRLGQRPPRGSIKKVRH